MGLCGFSAGWRERAGSRQRELELVTTDGGDQGEWAGGHWTAAMASDCNVRSSLPSLESRYCYPLARHHTQSHSHQAPQIKFK